MESQGKVCQGNEEDFAGAPGSIMGVYQRP